MAKSPFMKLLKSIGEADRIKPKRAKKAPPTAQDKFLKALDKQINFARSKAAGSDAKWTRGHWVTPEKDGRYSLRFGASALPVDGNRYFYVDDLDMAIQVLEGGRELVDDRAFVTELEMATERRSVPKKSNKK